MRAVPDPNVLVSAVLARSGRPAVLLRVWLDGAYELVVSPALLDELGRVLAYPKIARRVSRSEAQELLAVLRLQAELVADPDHAPTVRASDPDDDYLIGLAEAASAVIVSGETDLRTCHACRDDTRAGPRDHSCHQRRSTTLGVAAQPLRLSSRW